VKKYANNKTSVKYTVNGWLRIAQKKDEIPDESYNFVRIG